MMKNLLLIFILLLFINNANGGTQDCNEYGVYTDDGSVTHNFIWTGAGTQASHIYTSVCIINQYCGKVRVNSGYGDAGCSMNYGSFGPHGAHDSYTIRNNHVCENILYDERVFGGIDPLGWGGDLSTSHSTCIFYNPDNNYVLSGNVSCAPGNLYLYIYTDSWIEIGYDSMSDDDSYYFDIIDGYDYKLVFGDNHEYEFTCDGNKIYDYDICEYITMNFYDRCLTPVNGLANIYWSTTSPNANGVIIDGYTWEGFIFEDNVEIGDNIYVILTWYNGNQYYTYSVTESPQIIDITNLPIYYEMGVKTVTDAGAPISGVQVSVSQSCAYDGTKNKVTSGGWAWFTGCSNTGGSLTVSKAGYKSATMPFPTLMATAWDYRTSYIISMESDGSANDTSGDFNDTIINIDEVVTPDEEYNLDDNNADLHDGVEIWFTNEGGHRTTKISDTDTYVDLWFVNKNSNESSMTLEFQQSYTGNYYWDNLNWTIAYKKFGFKRIYNINFIPYYYYYRGKIYNDELLQWDRIRYLDVRNETKEEEEHYENLSTGLWFRHATVDHKIDYRNDIEIVCNAASNNTTLLDLDIELYNGSVLVDYINLTWADFSGASIKWFYIWEPDYDYTNGYNYTTKMIGYNGYVLRTDCVDCFTDDRKNKLTIKVKDIYGSTLTNCYIYLEDWGSLPTGSLYYNAYEGIDNGDYRYKASKLGYTGGGWESVNLADEDKIVWYVLSEDYTNTSIAATKFTDDDIKGFFFPLM
jgi:hypothetical protein